MIDQPFSFLEVRSRENAVRLIYTRTIRLELSSWTKEGESWRLGRKLFLSTNLRDEKSERGEQQSTCSHLKNLSA